ncbi:ABC transporter permease [Aminiphilus sp.]|jgi:phospholipid/cholesterol/gamma-HCH transport system permease protein|uniref:MlaE family ABC transporter permease n=1 Tax=Aminiphilus sp. TaxID=1872488 RepID=UPI002638CF9D|nr:ABC transporter permease [Aminiphilus sp.]
MSFFAWIGRWLLRFWGDLGAFALYGCRMACGIWGGRWGRREFFEQLDRIGVGSLSMVAVTSAFSGMVMAVQTLDQFVRFGATQYIGGVIAITMVREMSPVLTGLVVAGRVGAAMAAEIGSMKVTEQLDALRGFGLDDVSFVGSPRLLASCIMLPVLTVFSFAISILGAYLYVSTHGVSAFVFRRSVAVMLEPLDLYGGVTKGFVFGLLIAVSSCSEGFRAETGARGVGIATTSAVIWSNMLILAFNYLLSTLFFGGMPRGG